jgi:hypothetical protein
MKPSNAMAAMRSGCEAATAAGDIAALRAMLAPDVQWHDERGRLRADGDGAELAAATMRRRSAEGIFAGARLERWEPRGDQAFVVVTFGPDSPIERKAYLLTVRDGKIVRVQDQRC